MQPNVIFVGAGPIGLYTAIQAKLYNPSLNILMIERNVEYLRKHILNIDKKSFVGAHPDARLQKILAQFEGPVPTIDIESRLKSLAQSLGISFEHEKVDNVNALTSRYPSAHTIIGADGANSIVRQEIFHDEKLKEKTLQYIVEVKYHAKNCARKLGFFEYAHALTKINHLAVENVGRESKHLTPVTLAFFTDKETHDAFRALGVTAWKGMSLNKLKKQKDPKIASIAPSVLAWMEYRKKHTQEILIKDSDKIAAVAFSTYQSKAVVKYQNGKKFVLIGDAAMSVPYFRSINAGLKGGNYAAKLIANRLKNQNYQQEFEAIAHHEIRAAQHTNRLVHIGRFFTSIMQNSLHMINYAASMILNFCILSISQGKRRIILIATSHEPLRMGIF